MEKIKRHVGLMVLVILTVGLFISSQTTAIAGDREQARVQALVDRARITLKEFIGNPNYAWLNENLDRAKGVLIFPEILKGGFILGGSGGTGVFLVRDEKTGTWGEPAFYTLSSFTFGFQIGGEKTELVMLAMTEKAIDSLLTNSFKFGGDVSVAVGPMGIGTKMVPDILEVSADFYSFAKSKGLYAGLNLEGSVISVRNGLNRAYYGKAVTPADVIVRKEVSNKQSAELRETLQCKC
jgi:lipid-binding SYLF domain-containing protein